MRLAPLVFCLYCLRFRTYDCVCVRITGHNTGGLFDHNGISVPLAGFFKVQRSGREGLPCVFLNKGKVENNTIIIPSCLIKSPGDGRTSVNPKLVSISLEGKTIFHHGLLALNLFDHSVNLHKISHKAIASEEIPYL